MRKDILDLYEKIEDYDLTDIHSKGTLYRHKKSGARVAFVSNDDENKVFYIAFRTPPVDSTGIPHIIEHTVLCGSDKFPAKDPFVELAKGSLNTFLNAITYCDKTVYPVASCNDKDFQNLMHVYLDAVFHPNIYKREEIFKQEGWHYELEEPDGDITINGVVYNEMKGAYSSPEDVLDRMVYSSLFPDTIYHHESGGDPDVIPELTYEKYLDFHRSYYHPSNSYIYFYGDMDVEEKLRFLDEEYLSQYDRAFVDSEIHPQKPFRDMVEVHKDYSISSGESEVDNTYLAYNLAISTVLDKEVCMAFDVLDYALLSAPGAPVKKALLDAGIGKDVMGSFDDSALQPVFSVVAKNANVEDKDRFIEVIRNTLQEQVANGLDKKALLAGINSFEFRFREADFGSYPKGLIYGLDCMETWLYDDNKPFAQLYALDQFAFLKRMVDTDYFEKLIQKYLLDNKHGSIVVVEPKKGLNGKKEEALAKKLAEYKASLSKEQIQKLIEDTKQLKKYQEEPSSKEDLEKIPLLERTDLKREPMELTYEEDELDGVKMIQYPTYTGGITYMNLMFDLSGVSQEELPYVGLMKAILGYVDTENYGYGELSNEINIRTGGISSKISLYQHVVDGHLIPSFEIRNKCLQNQMKDTVKLIKEILFSSSLDDEKRLQEIISHVRSRLQMTLSSSGHSVSAVRAMSYFSPGAKFNELTNGIEFYRVVCDIDAHFEERKEKLIQIVSNLIHRIFRKENLLIHITSEEKDMGTVRESLPNLLDALYKEPIKQQKLVLSCEKRNEGFQDASQVQYVSRAGNFVSKGYDYTGALRILRVVLSYDYLWINVRVKGGAYGCMSGFGRLGDSYFSSYRDPNLSKTNQIFEKTPQYLRDFDVDERDMTKYIIGTVSDMDAPLNPSAKGNRALVAYLTGVTYEMLKKERDEVITATPEDIRRLAPLVEAVLEDNNLCVIGSEDMLKAEEDMFEHIEQLTQI